MMYRPLSQIRAANSTEQKVNPFSRLRLAPGEYEGDMKKARLAGPASIKTGALSDRGFRFRLFNSPFQPPNFRFKFGILGIQEEGIDAALPFHRPDRIGRNFQAYGFAQRLAKQRRLLQIGQEPAAGLVVGMADIVPRLHAATRKLATPGHFESSSRLKGRARQRRPRSCGFLGHALQTVKGTGADTVEAQNLFPSVPPSTITAY